MDDLEGTIREKNHDLQVPPLMKTPMLLQFWSRVWTPEIKWFRIQDLYPHHGLLWTVLG